MHRPHPPGYPPPRQEPRTVYQAPVAQTAPAPFPYAGGAAPDPRSVGPAWSRPAEHRPPPNAQYAPQHHQHQQHQQHQQQQQQQRHQQQQQPQQHRAPAPAPARSAPRERAQFAARQQKPGIFRRIVSALFTMISAGILVAGAAFVTLAIVNQKGLIDLADQDLPIVLPEQPIAIPDRALLVTKPDKLAEATWTTGTCGDYSNERDTPAYQAGRDSGSAGALRGKTAAMVIKLHSPSMVWTKAAEANVERAALMTQRFYLAQAQPRGIDLKFDLVPWGLKTAYSLPSLVVDASQRLPSNTMDLIRDGSKLAIETALGAKLDRVVSEIRKDGYTNVAFFVFFPVKTKARNFAVPSYRSAPKEYPEAAYLFAPSGELGHFAVTMAHEGMHLFGADDLYRIKNADKRDDDDVMGEYCTGFKKAKVGDATAFAVGWTNAPPVRGYKFDVK